MSSNPPIYIAHALGEINHLTYTNSKAAFKNNVSPGFSYFEADINLTKDNNTVLYHHKKPSSKADAWQAKKCYELTWKTLSTCRYGGRYPVKPSRTLSA
jgi:glycerophosphoryl diester phosphodiesterase